MMENVHHLCGQRKRELSSFDIVIASGRGFRPPKLSSALITTLLSPWIKSWLQLLMLILHFFLQQMAHAQSYLTCKVAAAE